MIKGLLDSIQYIYLIIYIWKCSYQHLWKPGFSNEDIDFIFESLNDIIFPMKKMSLVNVCLSKNQKQIMNKFK